MIMHMPRKSMFIIGILTILVHLGIWIFASWHASRILLLLLVGFSHCFFSQLVFLGKNKISIAYTHSSIPSY
jgi:hypothetical protein